MGNRYSAFDNPFEFVRTFFDFDYQQENAWREIQKRANEVGSGDIDQNRRRLLLEHARAKYAEKLVDVQRLDDRRDAFLRFAGGTLAFLVAAVKGLGVAFGFWITASMVLLLASSIVLLCSRRTRPHPASATIQTVREGIGEVENPEDWLAHGLYLNCEGLRAHELMMSAHLNFALMLLVAALLCLGPVILFFKQ